MIAQRGTTNVSFADIAKVAGCSHALPGYLFGSKNDLLLALVQDVFGRFRTELAVPLVGQKRGLDALLASQQAFLQTLDRPLPYTRALYVMIGEATGSSPELRAALDDHSEAVRRALRAMLAEGIERGEIRPDIDVDAQAVALLGQMRGIGTQVLLDPKAVDVPAVTAEVLTSTRLVLAAAGGATGPQAPGNRTGSGSVTWKGRSDGEESDRC